MAELLAAPAAPTIAAETDLPLRVELAVLTGDPAGSVAAGTARRLTGTTLDTRPGRPVLYLAAGRPVPAGGPGGDPEPHWTGIKIRVLPTADESGTVYVEVNVTHRRPRPDGRGYDEDCRRVVRPAGLGAAVRVGLAEPAPTWVEVAVRRAA